MKCILLIPDGVAIRNFVCSRFSELLSRTGDVVGWHALNEAVISQARERLDNQVTWEPLPPYREGLAERILRQGKLYSQLFWQRDSGLDHLLKMMRPRGRLANRAVGYAAKLVGRAYASRDGVARIDALHARACLRSPYLRAFEAYLAATRPDVVFCTHQRASRAVPAMLAARKLGIPTATFIYSWDNLPKGRMAVHADHFLVWGDVMKNQLLRYYPEVEPERVHVVGTPQFEHYTDDALIRPRDEFLSSVGLDPSRPVVCFSGDDVTTSPHDPTYLGDLAAALRELPAETRPQILFRRCPVDRSDRYDGTLRHYPEIAVSDPIWVAVREGDWTQVVATADDVALLANVVRHCDLVVNLGSTMAMDFATQGKPAIYVRYEAAGADLGWSIHEVYSLPHFGPVHELNPVYWADSPRELGPLVMRALQNPAEKAGARRAWLESHVRQPMDRASERCADVLRMIADTRHARCLPHQ